jgi:hypothetical protein
MRGFFRNKEINGNCLTRFWCQRAALDEVREVLRFRQFLTNNAELSSVSSMRPAFPFVMIRAQGAFSCIAELKTKGCYPVTIVTSALATQLVAVTY